MPVASIADLFAALARNEFGEIAGTFECEWVDFKSEPFRVDAKHHRQELAKDVAAFANASGGVIVIGFERELEPDSPREKAGAVRPIPRHLINQEQYRAVIEEWTYPPVRNVTFSWWPKDGADGVFTIHVPPVTEGDRPVLVREVHDEDARRAILLGVFERTGDRVTRFSEAEVHAWIRDGRRIQLFGLTGAGLDAALDAARSIPGPSPEERLERLGDDTRTAGFVGHRRYYLQAWPLADVEVQGLHASGPDGLRNILLNPPEVRRHGFGLRSAGDLSVLPGGGLRVHAERQSLSLQRDGLLTWIASAGPDFLAWQGERRGRKHGLHPIALVESTLEFARLYIGQILPRCSPGVQWWAVSGGFTDLWEDGGQTSLAPDLPDRLMPSAWVGWQDAPTDSFLIGAMQVGSEPPGVVAFRILRIIYANFGIDEAEIPLVSDGAVSESLIREFRV